jgi:hypothetical protein
MLKHYTYELNEETLREGTGFLQTSLLAYVPSGVFGTREFNVSSG